MAGRPKAMQLEELTRAMARVWEELNYGSLRLPLEGAE